MSEDEISKVHNRLLEVGFTDEMIDAMDEEELVLYVKAVLGEADEVSPQ